MAERYESPEFRGESRVCSAPGCFAGTRHGKPWCPRHIEKSEIAQRIQGELARREREIDLAANGRVRGDFHLIAEATNMLRESNGRTVAGLARDLSVPHATVKGLFAYMFRQGLALEGITKRGATTATLVKVRRKVGA
jgi:hypothetical protein